MNFSKLPTYIILRKQQLLFTSLHSLLFLIEVVNYDVLFSGIQQSDSDLVIYLHR